MSLFLPFFTQKSSHHHEYGAIEREESNQHVECHFESPEIIRDIVLGLSDGLTVNNKAKILLL